MKNVNWENVLVWGGILTITFLIWYGVYQIFF